ncbi:MAG: hypothetical protein AB1673_16655 [Actinomycetota bacterium]|jgi:hypothetical protein
MAVAANLEKGLTKAYENHSLSDLLDAPVDAIAGISEGDAVHLQEAFNIKTVGDLGRNKYVRLAVALADLGGFEG